MEAIRVRIRALEPEDLDELYAIENDTSIWQLGVTNVPYSKYLLHNYIANSNGDIYHDGQVRMMVETKQGNVIGIVIKQEHRHKGYATEVLRLIKDYALNILHLHQLYAVIACNNEEATMLFQHNGFDVQNVLKEWLYDGKTYYDAQIMQLFL